MEQLPAEAMLRAKFWARMAPVPWPARLPCRAKDSDATLVVCFIRQVNLSFKYGSEQQLTIETDLAALRAFSRFLDLGHNMGVPVLPVYDTGPDAAELLAENAAIYGCERVLIVQAARLPPHQGPIPSDWVLPPFPAGHHAGNGRGTFARSGSCNAMMGD